MGNSKSDFVLRAFFPLLVVGLLAFAGCGTSPEAVPSIPRTGSERSPVTEEPPATVPTGFGPAKITILPLSEITFPTGHDARVHAYVALLDAFGCSIKAPCTLRFEVYERVQRSAQARGPRVMIWPDVDLTHPTENHEAWRDFLRAYEFQLPLKADRDRTYILEATYLGPDGRRLSGETSISAGR